MEEEGSKGWIRTSPPLLNAVLTSFFLLSFSLDRKSEISHNPRQEEPP
jgi:hypothetical protein